MLIDNMVFELGRKQEIEEESEWEKMKIEHQHKMLETLINVLVKVVR